MGNIFKACKFWNDDEGKKCDICGREEETARHIFEYCVGNKVKSLSEVALSSDSSGICFLRGVKWLKKRVKLKKIEEEKINKTINQVM